MSGLISLGDTSVHKAGSYHRGWWKKQFLEEDVGVGSLCGLLHEHYQRGDLVYQEADQPAEREKR